MVGQITYTEEEIIFILQHSLTKEKKQQDTLREYQERFSKPLTMAQLRYVRAKYGHDPEFGTAMINGQVPDNGGNRKTAVPSQWQEVMAMPIQSPNDQSDQAFTPPTNEDESASEHHMLQILASHVYDSPAEIPENLTLSPEKVQQQNDVSQDEVSEDEQAGIDAEEYAAAHEKILQMFQMNPDRPYGEQPVQQYYEQMLYPSAVQKRKRDELEESSECSDSESFASVVEVLQESIPKRLKTQSQETSSQKELIQYSSPTPNNYVSQTTGHDEHTLSLLDADIPEVPSTPKNLDMGAYHVQAERDLSVSPLTKLLNSIDNEYPHEPTTDSSFFTQLDLQMDPSGYSAVNFDNAVFQEPNTSAVPTWAGTDSTMLSASPSLNFSQSMSYAPWQAPHNEAERNFWGTQSDTWQGATGYDTAPGFDFDPLVPPYPQTCAPFAYAEVMASAGGTYEGSEAFNSMQQQTEGQNIASFSGDMSNIDWNSMNNSGWEELYLPSAEPQGHDDYSQQFFGPLE
ncbi:hypothetical protein BDP81DRAFT_500361 [Colletotrichum phormii]|uniref:Clr5 domain-containing protein n=1 Tax=Colletotrichum phormii TaxID=359342 RepID=A0AAJ0EAX3_9PEZI|nr:uncharacterized protein BDP81DRAFT_500361 [Colletotrichum phormii]KAK1625021.1 hypothetical protein BDP81DRAFT_500361 [Colletotrichum phormii]